MTQAREDFVRPASEETIQRVAQRMRERNIEVVVVDDGDQARKVVLERLPEGAEVHSGKSKTHRHFWGEASGDVVPYPMNGLASYSSHAPCFTFVAFCSTGPIVKYKS